MTVSDDPVTLINVFEIDNADVEEFAAGWERRLAVMASRDGFISAELYRAELPDARFQLVNVARWRSRADFEAAVSSPEFRRAGGRGRARANPALYRVTTRRAGGG